MITDENTSEKQSNYSLSSILNSTNILTDETTRGKQSNQS